MSLPCLSKFIPKEWRIPLFGPVSLPIRPFGILVGIGVLAGYHLGQRRARQIGLDAELCARGMWWTVGVGFVVAHLVSVIFYFPDKLLQDPLMLFKVWENISSFGGFMGGLGGAFYFFRVKQRTSLLAYSEAILFGLIPGWVFGRMGCTVVHDHPGSPTDFLLGVRCGAGGATIHDLGLYELMFAALLTILVYGLARVRPFVGFYQALVLVLYAPVRFMFDFLRTEDELYLGLTPGQYLAVLMLAAGLLLAWYGLKLRQAGTLKPAELVSTMGRERRPTVPRMRKRRRRK